MLTPLFLFMILLTRSHSLRFSLGIKNFKKNVPNCIIILAGNKADLGEDRKVAKEHAEEFAHEKECPLLEVSSKTGENIEELFTKLGSMLTEKFPG